MVRPARSLDRLRRRGRVTVTGDGARRYRATSSRRPAALLRRRRGALAARRALELGAARAPTDAVAPLYLREADAVANFATRDAAVTAWTIRLAERRDVGELLEIEEAQFPEPWTRGILLDELGQTGDAPLHRRRGGEGGSWATSA